MASLIVKVSTLLDSQSKGITYQSIAFHPLARICTPEFLTIFDCATLWFISNSIVIEAAVNPGIIMDIPVP